MKESVLCPYYITALKNAFLLFIVLFITAKYKRVSTIRSALDGRKVCVVSPTCSVLLHTRYMDIVENATDNLMTCGPSYIKVIAVVYPYDRVSVV